MTNQTEFMQHRIETANAALDTFSNYTQPSEDVSENIIDLITNLCHKARAEGFKTEMILRLAGIHCDAETLAMRDENLAHLVSIKKKIAKKPRAISRIQQRMLPGTDVVVTLDNTSLWYTQTRSFPWELSNGTWVVLLVGKTGGYALDRVQPVKGKKPKRAK